ncbi:class F sortase [Streptomyces sp. NPDC012888]|uniref:class F sortase n=1 Tax=Streptomyces sp. NPDC012888 TaxID=3364855 RepID=UPI0036CA91E4
MRGDMRPAGRRGADRTGHGTGHRTARGTARRTGIAVDPRTRTAGRAGLLALAACVGVWLVTSGSAEQVRPPQPSPAEALAGIPPGPAGGAPAPLPGSRPTRIRIPGIGVDAPLTGLGLEPDGSLQTPPAHRLDLAGWYREGTTPGSAGTAIVAGHVDHATGPAVFYRLGALRRGARIEVPREDGRTAVFTVHAVEVYDADAFPDERVYGQAGRAELRVITCGGRFSPGTGYRGNVVVFAHLTGTYREPGPAAVRPTAPDRA